MSLAEHTQSPLLQGDKGYRISPALRDKIEQIAFKLRLSEPARRYLWQCIDGGPSRQVQGRMGNAVIRYPSRKMGLSLMLESRQGELAAVTLLEHDPSVLAYFAQPPQVELTLTREDGTTTTRTQYTPDLLIVREDQIAIRELRDQGRIFSASRTNSHQFYKDQAGQWRYRAAQEHFEALGFTYELIPNQSLPTLLIENTGFLEDYLLASAPRLPTERAQRLGEHIQRLRCASLAELQALHFTADEIYQAVVEGVLYFDLYGDRLSASTEVAFYSDQATHQAHRLLNQDRRERPLPIPGTLRLDEGTRLTYMGTAYTVACRGQGKLMLISDTGNSIELAEQALIQAHRDKLLTGGEDIRVLPGRRLTEVSPQALESALKKLQAMRKGDTNEFSERSLSRFRNLTASATTEIERLLALVDNIDRRGNRTPRVTEEHQKLIEKAVSQYYNTPECRTYKVTWDKYCGLASAQVDAQGAALRPLSYPSFVEFAKRLKSERDRRGKRAAYQQEDIYARLDMSFPVHGVTPHDVLYVDHTIANMALTAPHGGDLGKPTLTIGVDGHTCQARALILSYDPPSAKTVLLLLRDYVRRHQRLPRVLVTDNGKEFDSRELSHFTNIYGIQHRHRPPAQPRGGSPIERLMGATEEELFADLQGNTRIMKEDTRLVTQSVNPFNRANWTLPGLHGAVERYLFEQRGKRPHPALGMPPDDFEVMRIKETGERVWRTVHYDENIALLTCPHAKRPYHKVDRQRGVWVGGMWFNDPALRQVPQGAKVEVRVEPWHAGIVYVHTGKRWVAAFGNCPQWLVKRTQRETEIALREERRRNSQKAGGASVSPKQRKSRQTLWDPRDFDPRLNLQQMEMRCLYEKLSMGVATPEAAAYVARQLAKEDITANDDPIVIDAAPTPAPSIPVPSQPSTPTAPRHPSPEEAPRRRLGRFV